MDKLIAVINDNDEKIYFYYNEQSKIYADIEDGSIEDVRNLAQLLENPWDDGEINYIITIDTESSILTIDNDKPKWKCEYYAASYDFVEVSVFGYGNTQNDALNDCMETMKYIVSI